MQGRVFIIASVLQTYLLLLSDVSSLVISYSSLLLVNLQKLLRRANKFICQVLRQLIHYRASAGLDLYKYMVLVIRYSKDMSRASLGSSSKTVRSLLGPVVFSDTSLC